MSLFGSVPNPTSGHTGPDIAPPMQISRPGHLGVMEPSLNGQPNVPWASRTSSENLPTINNELFALNIDGSMRHRSCAGTSHLRSVSCLNLLTQHHPMLPSFVCQAIFETRVNHLLQASGTAAQRVLHKCKASNRHFPSVATKQCGLGQTPIFRYWYFTGTISCQRLRERERENRLATPEVQKEMWAGKL